jgi:hypothetical protein
MTCSPEKESSAENWFLSSRKQAELLISQYLEPLTHLLAKEQLCQLVEAAA